MIQIEKLPIPIDRETAYNQFTFINILARKGEVCEMKRLIESFPNHITSPVLQKAMEKALAAAQVDSIEFLMDYVDIVTHRYLLLFVFKNELTDNHILAIDMLYHKKPEFLEQARSSKKLGNYKSLQQIVDFIDVVKVREKMNEEIPVKETVVERVVKI